MGLATLLCLCVFLHGLFCCLLEPKSLADPTRVFVRQFCCGCVRQRLPQFQGSRGGNARPACLAMYARSSLWWEESNARAVSSLKLRILESVGRIVVRNGDKGETPRHEGVPCHALPARFAHFYSPGVGVDSVKKVKSLCL